MSDGALDSIRVYNGALGGAVDVYCHKLNMTKRHILNVSFPNVHGKRALSVFGHNDDNVVREIMKWGYWDAGKTVQLQRVLQRLGAGAVLLDNGAHIGRFTLAVAYSGYRVVAFEPFEANVGHILHSLCMAPAEVRARVTLLHCGLGISDGQPCELWRNMENFGNSHVLCGSQRQYTAGAVKFDEVHLRRLDRLLRRGDVPLRADDKLMVKVDTEGFEPFALMGGEAPLRQYRPAMIFSEYYPPFMERAAKAFGWNETRAAQLPQR